MMPSPSPTSRIPFPNVATPMQGKAMQCNMQVRQCLPCTFVTRGTNKTYVGAVADALYQQLGGEICRELSKARRINLAESVDRACRPGGNSWRQPGPPAHRASSRESHLGNAHGNK